MINKNKLFTKTISLLLLTLILINSFSLSFASTDIIYIDSLDDLLKFSDNASLDSYFKGVTVILRSDINISNIENFTIPIFAGVFDGQGYNITGFNINKKGSNLGLFRYLEEGAILKNLNVSGNIIPSGSKNIIGGIVGKNMGHIKQCSFKGNVMGKNNIGGIAGINEATATISNCVSEGSINGEHYVGGIVGQNLGTILKSTNLAKVNTKVTEVTSNLKDLDWSEINTTENVKAQTDTGGIAGYSSGFLQDCMNRGLIGYKQFGYNVGGIVGRQSGYINNCQNYNTVKGRKDIGGIVGQLEPNLILFYSEDTLQKLNKELNTLRNLMNKSFKNSRNSSSNISLQISNIIQAVDDSKDSMEVISRMAVEHIDTVENSINITAQRIRYTLDEIIPILDEAEILSKNITKALKNIEYGFDNLEITSEELSRAIDVGRSATNNLRNAMTSGQDAIGNLRDIINYIKNIESDENMLENFKNPPKEIKSNLNTLSNSYIDKGQAIKSFTEALENLNISTDSKDYQDIIDDLQNLINDTNNIAEILSRFDDILTCDSLDKIDSLLSKLENLFNDLNSAISNISYSLSKLGDASDQSQKAFRNFANGFNEFKSASKSMTIILSNLKELFDSLSSKPDIELPNISSEFRESGENLFDNINNISSKIKELNQEINDGNELLIQNLESVGDQIYGIFDLLTNSRESINLSGKVEDISHGNIDENSLSTLYKNQNYGDLEGIINVGGVVGIMAIEYDLNPEEDISKKGKPSFNFKYTSSAILKECINYGKVIGKKDYIGGIAGRMDLGIISTCENYGNIKSQEGNYVGGIAGASYTKIDKSFVLASLSGDNYIGGISGYGRDISNSYAFVEIENGSEWVGSIAGKTEGEIVNNYFVQNKIPAIDGISYSEKAAPLNYEELLKVETLPNPFTELSLTFLADGNIIKRIPFQYGDNFDLAKLPNIPIKDGYESHWEDFSFNQMSFNTTVQAVYIPLKTTLASNVFRSENNLPLILAEGQFDKDVVLNISSFDKKNIELPNQNYEILEAWDISLEGLEEKEKEHTLRLLPLETKRNLSIWQLKGNSWKKINSSTNGSYLVFSMNNKEGTFAVMKKKFSPIPLILIFSIGFLFIFLVKKFKDKKSPTLDKS